MSHPLGWRKPGAVFATHRSKCAACGEWIEEGDEIVLNAEEEEWVHARHADE